MLEYLKEQLDRTNYWLAFSETKNAALVAFNVAVVAAIGKFTSVNIWIWALSDFMIMVSTFICLLSFIPKSSMKKLCNDQNNQEINLLYYADIAKLETEMYLEKVRNEYHLHIIKWEEEICKDFAEEIIVNSRIAVRKYKLFKYAVMVDLMCIILFIMFILIA